MKKTIIAVISIVFLLSVTTVSARTQILPLAVQEPVDFTIQQIWSAVNNLQEQVNNIQLTPGPIGPQGERGPEGASLKVLDSNNNTIGILLNLDASGNAATIFTNSKLMVPLNIVNGNFYDGSYTTYELFYKQDNCQGDPYINEAINPYSVVVRNNRIDHYRSTSYDDIENDSYFMCIKRWNNICDCNYNNTLPFSTKIIPIPEPSFNGPLSIVNQ